MSVHATERLTPVDIPGRHQRAVAAIDRALGILVAIPACLLVVAEVVVLFAGVVSRYVFHKPLLWSDELAAMQSIWLAMLGAVIAFRCAEHMRMTAFISAARPGVRLFFEALALVVSVVFLAFVLGPAIDIAVEELPITTPALQISDAWRAAALPVGIGLMLLFGLLRLLQLPSWRTTLAAFAATAALTTGFWLAHPLLGTLGNYNLLVFFVGLVALLVFAGVPIAFAFGSATFGHLALATRLPTLMLIGRTDEGMGHIILLAVPLFVLLGLMIEMTGMARAMVGFLASLLGHVRGGLSYVLVGAMYLVSGISGSKAADMAAVAPVLFPEMKARVAKEGELLALLSATGAQTETVPPSIVLITIGSVTGVSIAALFTGGLLPGLVLGATLCGLVCWRQPARRHGGRRPPQRTDDRARAGHRAAGAGAPLRDPRGRNRGRRDDNRGVDHRHRLHDRRRAADLSAVPAPADRPDAGRHRGALGRDPPHHRHGHRHGLGAHAIRLLEHAGRRHEGLAGRHRCSSWSPRWLSSCWARCWRVSRPWCCSGR